MSDNPIFSYTKRDYESSRKEGLSQIPTLSKGTWTDLNPTDPGIIILDYVHAIVDMINFYQDHQALETFITTAKERANIFRIAKQLSYPIRSAKGSEVIVTFKSDFIYPYTIKIPKYTSVSTDNDIRFLTTEESYLKAGELSVDVHCTQGKLYTMSYTGTGLSRLSNVENAENQKIVLSSMNIDTDSIVITDATGRTWSPVDHLIFSTEVDRIYQVDISPEGVVSIEFGDGERGVIPKETDLLTIQYIVTDAENGQIGPNSIYKVDDPILDDNGASIEFRAYNENDSLGGSPVQDSETIRRLAPGAIKAQERAVTLSDFENLARLIDGVLDAKAYDINTNPDLLYHEVKVLIIPKDPSSPKDLLTQKVYKYLYSRMIPPTSLQVITPSEKSIDITLHYTKMSDAVDDSQIDYEVRKKVSDYFNDVASLVGEDFYPIDLASAVSSLENVKRVVSMKVEYTSAEGSRVSDEDYQRIPIDKFSVASLGTLDPILD